MSNSFFVKLTNNDVAFDSEFAGLSINANQVVFADASSFPIRMDPTTMNINAISDGTQSFFLGTGANNFLSIEVGMLTKNTRNDIDSFVVYLKS